LEWNPPSQTYGLNISGYTIQEKITAGVYDKIKDIGTTTKYSVSNLETDETYTFVVSARYSLGSASDISNEATATPTSSSKPPSSVTVTSPPTNLKAVASSPIQVDLSWDAPSDDGSAPISGYKIEVSVDSGDYITLEQNTGTPSRTFTHSERVPDTTYAYKVYAINSVGTSGSSNQVSVTPTASSESPPSDTTPSDTTPSDTTPSDTTPSDTTPSAPINFEAVLATTNQVNLTWDAPSDDGGASISGYKIEVKSDSGAFSVLSSITEKNTSYSHTGLVADNTYTYKVYAINSVGTSNPSLVSIATTEPKAQDPTKRIPGFPDPDKDPQYYVDRYNKEETYKKWFDSNFPDYSIYAVVGLPDPKDDPTKRIPGFPDPDKDPQYYVDRYNKEETYKKWFDSNFPDYSIYEVVGLSDPNYDVVGLPESSENETSKDNIFAQLVKKIFSWFGF